MNALWINNISKYKTSENSFETAKKIIYIKIKREVSLARKYKVNMPQEDIDKCMNLQDLLLLEARSAKRFWSIVRNLLREEYKFKSRIQHGNDVVNKLLDIGFHHISNILRKILAQHDIFTGLGLIHSPHRSGSEPLLYDLVEMFRTDLVVSEVLKFIKLKKKAIDKLDQKDIAYFIFKINKKLEKKFYIKEFKICESYRYYMELQVERFVKAVNHDEVFEPFTLLSRHENRCR